MKGYRKIMKAVAVILAFALIFSGMNVPGTALAATTAATAKNTVVKSITVSNLPAGTLTLKAGKSFALKTNVAAKELKFVTSNRRIATPSYCLPCLFQQKPLPQHFFLLPASACF